MYTPAFNSLENRALLLEGMRAWSFAILFTVDESGVPIATHLPLVVCDEGTHGVLGGHFARANPHWKSLAGRETLVVFSGPHSYVSPSLYTDRQSVPTWNYIAIHATGTAKLVEDDAGKDALLRNLIAIHEPAYAEQWKTLPQSYRASMLKNIVGFRIPITKIEGKFKLSQNRPDADRHNVRAAQEHGSPDERALAEWMSRLQIDPS